MALIDNSGSITISRGDCFKIPLFINIGTEEEPIRLDFKKFSDMEVYFGVYLPGGIFENSFIAKKFTHLDSNSLGDIMIALDPKDTLYVKPGRYIYSIKARMYNPIQGEWINTVVDSNNFYII